MSLNKCLPKESDTFLKRIARLQSELQKTVLDGWLIEDPLDLYYLTGESFSIGQLWIGQKGVLLLVDERYIEKARQAVAVPVALKSWDACLDFIQRNLIKKIGFDGDKTTFTRVQELQKKLNCLELESIGSITQDLRKTKDSQELVWIRKSAEILWQGYLYIKSLLKEGVKELEVAKKFEIFCLEQGADGLSFEPIIAFGENSALPHYRAGERALKKGDIVLIDIGAVFHKYASDMTRVVFFGDPDPFLDHWLDLTILAQQAALNLCKPGVKVADLDKAARSVFKKEEIEQYFVHSLGHGVGLEVHESPRLRFDQEGVLTSGMVITLEPGLYLPGKGGVRYEDMIVITDNGFENLFPFEKAFL